MKPFEFGTLERTRTTNKGKPSQAKCNKERQIRTKQNILNTRIVNLSSIELTQSETSLLRRGLNFCPTPPPPKPEDLDADIDAFARRINLKEYYAPVNIDEIQQDSSYHCSVLEKLNKRDRQVYYRQSREPYLNSYVTKLRQDIRERLAYNHRFQRDNLNKRERVALKRLRNNKDIIIKPADKGGATVILNTGDYITEAMRQLSNEEYYKRVEEDLTSQHEQLINQLISGLINDGDLDMDTGQLLRPANSRTPIFYMLPKIHKPNNPGRPVISSVNSHMEKLSAYVDEFLRPLAQALPSHIRDTTDFIIRLKNLGRVPENSILATLDIPSLYTNIDTDNGLAIIEEELTKTDQTQPSAKTLTCLLEKVLKLNNFTFDNHNFIQVKGTAMGTRAAPNFANVYMGRFEDTFVYRTEWYHYIIDWVRFIDDIFLIWKGDESSLTTFIKYLNGVESSIKFTHEKSYKSVNFLDTKVIKDVQGIISTDIFQKPTDTHPYLHWTSAHPPHLKKSIPYSQALRLRRICSSTTILKQRILKYSNFFVACGYKRDRALSEMRKVLSLTQDESLRVRERHTTSCIPFVTTYNPRTSYIAEVANRNWHFLQSKERLAHIFRERPVIAYKRSKSLRDVLVRSSEGHAIIKGSCGPCNKPKCSWCVLINKTSTFTGTQRDDKVFDIFHTVNCQSTFVIYIIECRICRLQYVGKSETAFNLRLNNHRNHIKRGINSCELSEHFLHNSRSHDFSKDVTITIIEQIKRSNMTIERKKEILRGREIFWQSRLNTLQPNGLNKRMG